MSDYARCPNDRSFMSYVTQTVYRIAPTHESRDGSRKVFLRTTAIAYCTTCDTAPEKERFLR